MNILISACLMGEKCRYDGRTKNHINISELKENHSLFPVCPEVDGGLPVPRAPAEIINGKVINKEGKDVTKEYTSGALHALKIALENNCKIAILKARSPSCGKGKIYDGTFSGKLTNGDGILVDLLQAHGVTVYTEEEIEKQQVLHP